MRIRFMVLIFFITLGIALALTASTEAAKASSWSIVSAADVLKDVAADPSQLKLVNVWATWCPPCKEELPEFIKFSTQHPKIPVYFVSGDDRADRKKAEDFLRGLGARDRLYQLEHVDEKQLKTFSPAWAGALPGTFIYDKTGQLLQFWVGRNTAQNLAERIKTLDPGALKR